jgi:hypothetical protein
VSQYILPEASDPHELSSRFLTLRSTHDISISVEDSSQIRMYFVDYHTSYLHTIIPSSHHRPIEPVLG